MAYQDKPPIEELTYLMHYGVGHEAGGHSGRYPWGSGEERYQHSSDFLARIEELQKEGLKETEIAKAMGFVDPVTGRTQTTKLRVQMSLAGDERRAAEVARAEKLRAEGMSLTKIAEEMGYASDSSVRALLDQKAKERMNTAKTTAEFLKSQVDQNGMYDVGVGTEKYLGNISREKLEQALYLLEMQGYPTWGGGLPQVTNPGKQINLKVLCPAGTPHSEIYNFEKINSFATTEYQTTDDGESFKKFEYPSSMDSNRLSIRYRDDGGLERDGLIELRRGVQDLSLGDSNYSQVRILVDGTHYLKGMAVYSDDLPDGVDVRFNTNKTPDIPVMGSKNSTILKPIKSDPEDPFGSLIMPKGQSYYDDPNGNYTDPITGNKQSLSLINKRADEKDWSDWSNALPSQFLSKQPMKLINQQLNIAKDDKQIEFDEICSLTNPTVKKVRLQKFAEECDSAAVQLKAAALPGQKYHVILPINTLKDNEIYAPNYKDGETLALVRYPHAGTFEIPIVTVNNKNKLGRDIIKNGSDAVGINKNVADRLSGADFDGDTVMVIPTNNTIHIQSRKNLKGLEGFDPKVEYPYHEGMKLMTKRQTQNEMGRISNLITDMTLKGANDDDLAAAVRHSMVVIDAEKHRLDYKQSEINNNIAGLKRKYQHTVDPETGEDHYGGASTLISKAKKKEVVLKRKGSPRIDPETGELIYKEVVETYDTVKVKNDKGKWVDASREDMKQYRDDKKNGRSLENYKVKTNVRTQDTTLMEVTKDARKLSSGTAQEEAYADYANYMKSLANKARKEYLSTGRIKYSAEAKSKYQEEVSSLMSKLNTSLMNSPRERKAQLLANSEVKQKTRDNPDLYDDKATLKKVKQKAMTKSRDAVGAHRNTIKMTDSEWDAVQSGAISENVLLKIINNMDSDELLRRSTPKQTRTVSDSKIARMRSMQNNGYTTSQIAEALGLSTSTVSKYL